MNTLKSFETVIEIAKYGSVSKAAKVLKISQSTLSKYLARLESELGLELFDRKRIPLRLTEAGQKYIDAGRKISDSYKKLSRELEGIKNGNSDTLTIGLSPTRAHFVLPLLVEYFYKINDGTRLVFKERTAAQLNAELYAGELDLIISIKYDGTRNFGAVELFSEDILLAIPKKYEGMKVEEILKVCNYISPEKGLNISNMLTDILRENDLPEPIIEVQSIESALSLANTGLGVSLVPSYVKHYNSYENVFFAEIPQNLKRGRHINTRRDICVFYNQGSELATAEKDFIKACIKAHQ